jgi:hypothetical protein
MEKKIGRVVQMNTVFNETVQVYLDWGGGNNPKDPQNVMVNMWVGQNGSIVYIVNGHGSSDTGSARNFAELVTKLQGYRANPVGLPGDTAPAVPAPVDGKKPGSTEKDILDSAY